MSHVANIAHGIGVGVLCAFFFYLAGLVVTPRRWDQLLRGAGLVVLGSALYVILCWIAIRVMRIPLAFVALAFVGGVLGLSILRNSRVVDAVTAGVASRSLRAGVLLFVSFYAVTYAMTRQPDADIFLPPAWSGNPDLLTYVRYAKHLLIFGSPDLAAPTFDYLRSPAAAQLLAGFSLFFNQDPLSAAIPAEFALVALIGVGVVGVCRSVFALPMATAVIIACIFITNPYFKRVFSAYQLSPLMTVPIFLFLLWLMIRARSSGAPVVAVVAATAAACVLLVFNGVAALISGMALAGSDVLKSVILTMGVVSLAMVASAVQREDALGRIARNPTDRRLVVAGFVYVVIALIAGNVAVHAARERVPWRMPGKWRGIEQLKNLHLGELTVKIEHDPNGLLIDVTRYFLPDVKVHVLTPRVRVRDLPFEAISRKNPILIQNFGCEGVGHSDVMPIDDVGCVIFAPPAFKLDEPYPFNRTFLFVAFDGMTDREAGGRRNMGRGLSLRLLADPERTRVDRDLHVNVFVNPLLPTGVMPQRLILKWGAGRTGEVTVATEEWVSIPISAGDWTGDRVSRLPISIAIPDGRTILFHELSISEHPAGRLIR